MNHAVIVATLVLISPLPAQMCTGQRLWGPYGMLLSGTARISAHEAPVADLASLTLNYDGTVSGYSSVNFDGLLLGNPVTGKYELLPDCTFKLSLQDDSGAFQHFQGKTTMDGRRIDLRQTETGTGERGVMEKAAASCSEKDIRAAYTFTLSGAATAIATGGGTRPVALAGAISLDVNRKLHLVRPNPAPATYEVQPGCIVQFEFPNLGATGGAMHLRGMIVNGGAEILAIQTDPGQPVSAIFVSR